MLRKIVSLLSITMILAACNSSGSGDINSEIDTPDNTLISGTPDSEEIKSVMESGTVNHDTTILVPESDSGEKVFTLSADMNSKGTLTVSESTLTIKSL
ncbi:hypothetical protein [Thaumasiovibrio subtropicus]|uniref:hypothetical protein n=1 Tax=Thaumasiovibrio subtropicus TaxID=1891207 RepID=UPI000B359600|nr:hypothetical protein [Thaumasiovibrio subtropicus]